MGARFVFAGDVMLRAIGLGGLILVTGLTGAASAIEILKKEPGKGTLSCGSAVYVDDGKCPKGQVTMVVAEGGGKRGRSCVARPG